MRAKRTDSFTPLAIVQGAVALLQLTPPWWHRFAACRGKDSDVFFIEQGGTAKAAKVLCAR
ncbi:MAG: WhiB family transcriptional regulator [Actinobacteria bacterium]|nr:WhiB family transcriptional regulator [Actinomycetota bacterium]